MSRNFDTDQTSADPYVRELARQLACDICGCRCHKGLSVTCVCGGGWECVAAKAEPLIEKMLESYGSFRQQYGFTKGTERAAQKLNASADLCQDEYNPHAQFCRNMANQIRSLSLLSQPELTRAARCGSAKGRRV